MVTRIVALLFLPILVQATELGDTIGALSPGQSATVAGNNCRDYTLYSAHVGGATTLEYGGQGAWDSATEQAEFIGAGHGSGSIWRWWQYDAASNTCRHRVNPPPNSTHTYQHLAIGDGGKRRYVDYKYGSGPWVSEFNGSRWVYFQNAQYAQITSGHVWSNALQTWAVVNGYQSLFFTPNGVVQDWRLFDEGGPYHVWAVVSHTDGHIYWGGGNRNRKWWRYDGQSSTPLPNLPWDCQIGQGASRCVPVASADGILFFRDNGSVWRFDGGFTDTGWQHPYATGGDRNYVLIDLAPNYPGVLGVYEDGNAAIGFRVMKTSGASAPPPPPPTSSPPVAGFSASPPAVTCDVDFQDSSQGSTGYSWSFGDGGVSAQASPSHKYSAGSYTVTQTVSNPDGTDVSSQVITCP